MLEIVAGTRVGSEYSGSIFQLLFKEKKLAFPRGIMLPFWKIQNNGLAMPKN